MITSAANAKVKNIIALQKKARERRTQGLFVAEGLRLVSEAPADWVQEVYASEGFAADHAAFLAEYAEYEVLSDALFAKVSDTNTPQGILAVLRMPAYELADLLRADRTLLLVLEDIQDPGNLGTMLRTGEGAGVTGVLMNRNTADIFSPKVVRATMGSIYRVPFFVTDDLPGELERIRQAGVTVYAAHLQGEAAYDAFDYGTAAAFLIGNEGNGLTDETAACADAYVRIPMEGQVESLNAAVSAALLLYEANRQRRYI